MGKRVCKKYSHQIPLDQLHQRIVALASEETGSTSSDDSIYVWPDGDAYRIGGKYSGFNVKGRIVPAAGKLEIEVELPMLAGLFTGKVEQYIEGQAAILLR